ncbi:telomerase reverse transcriptase [Elysia marginata]|uniref:Telomerase reverse transcriptase n=1 Tax=Elysia marginata TaxID=1093978 RepID=A0AAV4EWA5_9GAST|nr:telomerase reverse transcriptase [Elysia marginata]
MWDLKNRNDIIIKPADKGGAVVVWRKDLYLAEGARQLSNSTFYRQRSNDSTIPNNSKVKDAVSDLIDAGHLPPSSKYFTYNNSELGHPVFYMLPKIHKSNNPCRSIVSACACPTEQISAYLDSVFQPLVMLLPTCIKDTNHALNIFSQVVLPTNQLIHLFLLDVTSLYTSIPHADGLAVVKRFLNTRTSPVVSTDTLVRLTELVLTLNSFEFSGEFFDQISGVAMGTKMGPN